MRPGWEFSPRWWAFLLAAAACAGAIALGQWQAGRAAERRAALAQLEAAARGPVLEYPAGAFDTAALVRRRLAARGEFQQHFTVLLDYRLHRGRAGFHVVQPLRLAGTDVHVLVLRGWIAAPANRSEKPVFATPQGEVRVEGIALERLPQFLEPAGAEPCRPEAAPCIWQNLSREKFAAWSGTAVAPLIIEQSNALADGLDRNWDRVEAGYLKNEMYALQWYSLAALSAVLFVALSFRRATVRAAAPESAPLRGRRTLVAIGSVFLLPVVIGWLAYLTGRVPGATSNYGALIPPRPLSMEPFVALRGKWILLQFDDGACAAQCERKHYVMRQARRAQGVNAARIERLWILTDATAPRPELLAAIEGTRMARAEPALRAAFPADAALADHIWLVDPLGNLMLRFPLDADPGRVVKDLERLLRSSGFG